MISQSPTTGGTVVGRAHRVVLIPISIWFVVTPVWMIQFECGQKQVGTWYPLTIYGIFVLGVSVMLTLIAARLYAMHGVGRPVYDIAIWFLTATLLALPLAAAAVLTDFIQGIDPKLDDRMAGRLQNALTVGCFVELLPIFFLTEWTLSSAATAYREFKAGYQEA